jgi:hypothetical protein
MKLSRRSFFAAATLGAAAGLGLGRAAKPKQATEPRTKGARYELSAHVRKYYRSAKV